MTEPDPNRVAIEAKVAFLERAVELLQASILDQNRTLADLADRVGHLEREREQGDEDIAPHDAPPPHY